MRLFVGLPVPVDLDPIVDEAKRLHNARPVPSNRFHITLQFLDEQEDVVGIRAALRKCLDGQPAPHVRVHGIGAFPDTRRARILWAGVDDGTEHPVAALAERVQAALAPWRAPEDRDFRPHITLGRTRNPRDVSLWADGYAARTWWDGPLDRVALYQSEVGPTGRIYRKADTWRLRPA